MVQTNELKAIIAKNDLSQAKVAKELGITPDTFYRKMKLGVFGSDEIQKMIALLDIKNPMEIFFADTVT